MGSKAAQATGKAGQAGPTYHLILSLPLLPASQEMRTLGQAGKQLSSGGLCVERSMETGSGVADYLSRS